MRRRLSRLTAVTALWLLAVPAAAVVNYRSIGAAPNYTAGTITVTSGSATVDGSGTTWRASNRGRGDRIYINGVNYVVAAVLSDTRLQLTTTYAGPDATYSSPNYLIARQFTNLGDWENCIDGPPLPAACTVSVPANGNFVTADRSEVGIAYDDNLAGSDLSGGLLINGSVTDATHTITLTADGGNRHYGLPGQGVWVAASGGADAIEISDDFVTVEWMETSGGSGGAEGITVSAIGAGTASQVVVQNNLVHDAAGCGIGFYDDDGRIDVLNNIVYSNSLCGLNVSPGSLLAGSRFRVLNNTFYANTNEGIRKTAGVSAAATLLLRNNIAVGNGGADYTADPVDSVDPMSSHNIDEDGSGGSGPGTHNPGGGAVTSTVLALLFVNAGGGNLHASPGSSAEGVGASLDAIFTTDIDGEVRSAPWDIGADQIEPATVTLAVNYRSVGTIGNTSGTLSATQGSPVVTDATATWRAANRGRGDRIDIGGTNYTVLSADSQTQITLTTSFAATDGSYAYTIHRQFPTLSAWEDCIDGPSNGGSCAPFPEVGASLVADDRSEVGVVYDDAPYTSGVVIDGVVATNTDATHTITLTADVLNRHHGRAGLGVVVDNGANTTPAILVQDDFVTVEWLEVTGGNAVGLAYGIWVQNIAATSQVVIRNNLVQGVSDHAIYTEELDSRIDIYNNIVYRAGPSGSGASGIRFQGNPLAAGSRFRVLNNTVYASAGPGIFKGGGGAASAPTLLLRNNISHSSGGGLPDYNVTPSSARDPGSGNNISGDTSATSDTGGGWDSVPLGYCGTGACLDFVSTGVGTEDLHLLGTSFAIDKGADLSSVFTTEIDPTSRSGSWDVGADEYLGSTAVTLLSFEGRGVPSGVEVTWQTASELSNLGFHLYRATTEEGPYARVTASLVPGLGSSPVGAPYAYVDAGLVSGQRYHYRLEDVDTASVSTWHGPIAAVAGAGGPPPPGEGGGVGDDGRGGGAEDGSGSGGGPGGSPESCPGWVVSMHGESGTGSLECTAYGDPDAVSLDVVSRDSRSAVLELRTGGFWAVAEADGTVRAYVRGFDVPSEATALALPLRRALVGAVVGRQVRLVSAEDLELRRFPGLRPSAVGVADLRVARDGTVRPVRRAVAARRASRGYSPAQVARLSGTVFQGEKKSAVLELMPLRFDGGRDELVLSGRVRVRLVFAGIAPGEWETGSGGRLARRVSGPDREALAQIHTTRGGLHAVTFEEVFPGQRRGVPTSFLRLQRQGEVVPFRVEPTESVFGPGSALYFHADREASSTDFTSDVAYELVKSRDGGAMATVLGTPQGPALLLSPVGSSSFETNRIYQSGLLEAEDVWLWEAMASGASRTKSFTLAGLDTGSTDSGRVVAFLQGGSASGVAVDHHVRVWVNGSEVGETSFSGKGAHRVELPVPASVLREGANEVQLTNLGDTGVSSLVFLDRFTVEYPQRPEARAGVLEGEWAQGGTVEVGGLAGPAVVLDVTGGARWLTGVEALPGAVRFRAEPGRRYLVVSQEGVLSPRVERPAPSTLRSLENQADYLLIAPASFLAAAEPLLVRRASQGLVTKAVSLEEIATVFGHGRPSGEAIRSFVSYAYHSWAAPSARYVVLLGDATYDPRRFLAGSWESPLPALWGKTSYLWTALDPSLGAVNGEDELPDVAIGRIPATTPEQAETLVAKLLAWEESGQGLGGKVGLVADNRDAAGDFEADAADIRASFLPDRETTVLQVGQLGSATRPAIQAALDGGLSLLSYVGHGGSAVWASENVWNSWDAPKLLAQSLQPLLLTMNCLNGYFVGTNFDSLSESLLKAEGRGAIAAFSPSGLSVDGPAHQYHRAVMAELTGNRHERLGDAILAAQATYAATGLMPELLSVYHLFGDPAMPIR